MSNIAISYARFSSAGQAEGHSLSRQIEGAEAYAVQHGLVLDHSLSFKDLGVSAWDQSNVQRGALGLFLEAVRAGKIPVGATLIIESFDRLSRATPREALAIFITILNAGLNVVTLTDPPKRFSAASIDDNMFQLLEALLEMHRAHGESERKSNLLAQSWANRRKLAVEDGRVMTSKAPLWIRAEGPPRNKTFSLIPERVAIVNRVIEMAKSGVGSHTIIKTLNSEGIPAWVRSEKEQAKKTRPKAWEPSYIQKMLTQRALYGAVEIKGGEIIEGYYPQVIDYNEYVHLQALRGTRATRKASSRKGVTVTNLFSGLLKCGYCGSNMIVNGYTSRKTGVQQKYVACHGARTGASECRMHAWPLEELEPALLFWMTQIDYGKLVGNKVRDNIDIERENLAGIEERVADLKRAIMNGNVAIEQGLMSMIPRVKAHEGELIHAEKTLLSQKKKVEALALQEGGGASHMKGLVALFKALKETTEELPLRLLREQISAAINQVVERIVLYPVGRNTKGGKEGRYAEVFFKNGAERTIEAGEC